MHTFTRRRGLALAGAALAAAACPLGAGASAELRSWSLGGTFRRTGIHDVAPAPDGNVWFTAQQSGHLGWFEPRSGRTELIALGQRSAPHGVIQGPNGTAWITDGGLNAIVRVRWPQRDLAVFPLPDGRGNVNLNTAAFDGEGVLWFTGQSGVIGRLDPMIGRVTLREAPRGTGPYGICATPAGEVWFCSLAGGYIARIDRESGQAQVVEPPTPRQGARRIWSDSRGRLWVSEWNSGQLSMHDPAGGQWRQWRLPGEAPRPYAVYVDETDRVWVSDFGANAVLRFDPARERFESWRLPRADANVRQIHGRRGEVWLPESGTEHLSSLPTA